MTTPIITFVTYERRAWMRLRDHIVVFDREPDFERFSRDTSGSVLRILRIWVAAPTSGSPVTRQYMGSVRRFERGGWMSRRELLRLFRRARITARRVGENANTFCARLSEFLRDNFEQSQGMTDPAEAGFSACGRDGRRFL